MRINKLYAFLLSTLLLISNCFGIRIETEQIIYSNNVSTCSNLNVNGTLKLADGTILIASNGFIGTITPDLSTTNIFVTTSNLNDLVISISNTTDLTVSNIYVDINYLSNLITDVGIQVLTNIANINTLSNDSYNTILNLNTVSNTLEQAIININSVSNNLDIVSNKSEIIRIDLNTLSNNVSGFTSIVHSNPAVFANSNQGYRADLVFNRGDITYSNNVWANTNEFDDLSYFAGKVHMHSMPFIGNNPEVHMSGEDFEIGGIGPGISCFRSRGTELLPTSVQLDDVIGEFTGRGYGDTDYGIYSDGRITIRATEPHTDTAHGTRIDFETTLLGQTSKVVRASISDQGFYSYRGFRTVSGPYQNTEWMTYADVEARIASLAGTTLYGTSNANPYLIGTGIGSFWPDAPLSADPVTISITNGVNLLGAYAYTNAIIGGLLKGSYNGKIYAKIDSSTNYVYLVAYLIAASNTGVQIISGAAINTNAVDYVTINAFPMGITLINDYTTTATNKYMGVIVYAVSDGDTTISIYGGDGYASSLTTPPLDYQANRATPGATSIDFSGCPSINSAVYNPTNQQFTLLGPTIVKSFNTRINDVVLNSSDIVGAGGVLTNSLLSISNSLIAVSNIAETAQMSANSVSNNLTIVSNDVEFFKTNVYTDINSSSNSLYNLIVNVNTISNNLNFVSNNLQTLSGNFNTLSNYVASTNVIKYGESNVVLNFSSATGSNAVLGNQFVTYDQLLSQDALQGNTFYGCTNIHDVFPGFLQFRPDPPSGWSQAYVLSSGTNTIGSRLTTNTFNKLPVGFYEHTVYMTADNDTVAYFSRLIAIDSTTGYTNFLGDVDAVANVNGMAINPYVTRTRIINEYLPTNSFYLGVIRYAIRTGVAVTLTIYGGNGYATHLDTPSLSGVIGISTVTLSPIPIDNSIVNGHSFTLGTLPSTAVAISTNLNLMNISPQTITNNIGRYGTIQGYHGDLMLTTNFAPISQFVMIGVFSDAGLTDCSFLSASNKFATSAMSTNSIIGTNILTLVDASDFIPPCRIYAVASNWMTTVSTKVGNSLYLTGITPTALASNDIISTVSSFSFTENSDSNIYINIWRSSTNIVPVKLNLKVQ